MYSNNILNFQESTTILNACTKKSENILKAPRSCNEKLKNTGVNSVIFYSLILAYIEYSYGKNSLLNKNFKNQIGLLAIRQYLLKTPYSDIYNNSYNVLI